MTGGFLDFLAQTQFLQDFLWFSFNFLNERPSLASGTSGSRSILLRKPKEIKGNPVKIGVESKNPKILQSFFLILLTLA